MARQRWIDATRGICILLVVVLHTQGALAENGIDVTGLEPMNAALASVRMPGFFLVSGLLADSVLRAPWRDFLRRRPLLFAYLYVFWSLIFVAAFAAIATVGSAAVSEEIEQNLRLLVRVDGVLWYFAALAIYFLLARLTVRVPATVQCAAALTLYLLVVSGPARTGSWGADHILQLYVFFVAGRFARERIVAWVARVDGRQTIVLFAVWLGGVLALKAAGADDIWMIAVMSPIGAAMVLAVAAQAAGTRPGLTLERVGADTLPVYVLHPLVLAALGAALSAAGAHRNEVPIGLAIVLVLISSAGVAVASVVVGRMLRSLPWLFDLPGGGVRRVASARVIAGTATDHTTSSRAPLAGRPT